MRFNSYLLSTAHDDYCQVKLGYNHKSLKIHTFLADKGICNCSCLFEVSDVI